MAETKEQPTQGTLDSLVGGSAAQEPVVRSIPEWLKKSPLGGLKPETKTTARQLVPPTSEAAEEILVGRKAQEERARPWRISKDALNVMREVVKK